MQPRPELVSSGFCLAASPDLFVFCLPRGGATEIDLREAGACKLDARWFNPRSGDWLDGPAVRGGPNDLRAPGAEDWVLLVTVRNKSGEPPRLEGGQ